MKKMIRRLRPMLSAAVILCAFAGASLGDTLAAPKSQESGGAEREGRHQDELTFTQIDFPGATITLANAISNRDQIVGIYIDVSGAQHGFLLDDGFAPLDFPGADGTAPIGINDRGQIVGLFGDAGGAEHGFLLDNGTFTQIDFPRGVDTNPNSISNRGQIVGHVGPVGAFHGFLFNDGAFTQIDVPDALETAAIGINNRGRITGYFRDRGDLFHGFLLNNGVFTQIDFPDAPQTQAYGINDRGEIVGIFGEAVEQAHGFLLSDGVYTQIDFPKAAATIPSGINNRGQIVGYFGDSTDVAHGFLATKEQFSGKAVGVGSGENAAVEIFGRFTSPTDLDLSASTLTITSLLNEQAGNAELVRGLPLVLTAAPGSRRKLALFIDRSRPNIVSVTIQDAGSDKFIFKIKVNDATIISPQNCSPSRLTTSFRLDASSKPPIIVSTERSWFCFGPSNRFLKTH